MTSAADVPAPPRRASRRRLAAAVAALAIAGAVAAVVALRGHGSAGGVAGNGTRTALATVTRRTLTSRTEVNGTLGFAGDRAVVNAAAGVVTALPHVGDVIRRGRALYRVAGKPVLLLYGRTPAYRTLNVGMSGADVAQLNANLVALGYVSASALDPRSDHFTWATRYGLERLQAAHGLAQTGRLDLGRAVFLPGPARITRVTATLGATVHPGAIVAQATSTRRRVTVDLDASQQASVEPRDRVAITLPDGRTTSGVVTSVGKVASGSSGNATVPVYIAPRHPRVTGRLDRATVRVAITTARVRRALVVPVTALLARAGGRYAVEIVDARGAHRLVAVRLGLFDDARGLVQVSGALTPGDRVVVPTP